MARSPYLRRTGLDVYLFPAVVGGGLGDIAEVLDAGRWVAAAGFRPRLYRRTGHPLPADVDDRWDLAGFDRSSEIHAPAPRALTIAANWGVSAAPATGEPLSRGGPWTAEAADVEDTYRPDRTLHVSLEEFARTLTAREENLERFREGGVRSREIRRRRTGAEFDRGTAEFRAAFRRFRGFERPNVLHLFPGFRPSSAFGREVPEAIQVGPLWPACRGRRRRSTPSRSWVWYASPSSSARLVEGIANGLRGSGVESVLVRSTRPLPLPNDPTPRWASADPLKDDRWRAQFDRAELRVVTGSRTLLEALQTGGPFLYFNGILGEGTRTHRHRPEKIVALLRAWKSRRVASRYLRDLRDFSLGRRVPEIVRTASRDRTWREGFPRATAVSGYPRGREDAGEFLVGLAQSFERTAHDSAEFVRKVRGDRRAPAAREG